ncbi:hypothetical protein DRQ50_03950 [bacterium]|nr:MAG: hypothetical protein DRQ50_03950 [bacterium]
MKTTSIAIEPDGNLRQLPEEQALTGWRDGQGPFWIDLEGDAVEEMVAWLLQLGLDPKLMDLLQTGEHDSKILPFDAAVYFEYPVMSEDEDRDPELFGWLCLDRLVVTMRERPVTDSPLAKAALPRLRLQEPNVTSLVSGLIIVHSMHLRRHANVLRDCVRRLADRMDDDPGSVPLADILKLKHKILVLDGVASDQLAAFDVLRAVDVPVLHMTQVADYFQIALGNSRATDRGIDRLDSGARNLQQRHESAQQDKTNRRLAMLTILSAIFSPLTLLAGIYGMNFEYMPELGYRYAYFIALGAMVVIGGGLYWYLRSRGWLK